MLNNIGPTGLLLVAVVVLVLFGRGKVAGLMGEVGKGITSFKRGLSRSPVREGATRRRGQDNSPRACRFGFASVTRRPYYGGEERWLCRRDPRET